jgi:hypothetical protein
VTAVDAVAEVLRLSRERTCLAADYILEWEPPHDRERLRA